jgi:hypothetical protein
MNHRNKLAPPRAEGGDATGEVVSPGQSSVVENRQGRQKQVRQPQQDRLATPDTKHHFCRWRTPQTGS